MKKKLSLLILVACVIAATVNAQQIDQNSLRKIAQKVQPQGFDNHSFGIFYFSGKDVYSLRSYNICQSDSIDDLKINPSYSSFAILAHNKKGRARVGIYSAGEKDRLLKTIQLKNANTTAIAYSYDAKQLAIASSDKQISIYNPNTYQIIKTYTSSFVPTKMEYSDNNYFLIASDGSGLEVWNLERDIVRTTIRPDSPVNDFQFCNNSSQLIVMLKNGKMNVYDTKTFKLLQTIDDLGSAIACYPNNDGKYVSVLNNDRRISIINLLDPTERHIIGCPVGGVTDLRMVTSNIDNQTYLIYNDASNINYHPILGLTPYYNKMMTSMLNERLNQWMKQMPDETLEAYHARVNETTRAVQVKEMERELATKMATGLLESSDVSIGNYNPSTNSLALHFNSMPDIFLDVPVNDVNAFTNADKLEFRNTKYGLNPNDKFELVYAEVYNPENGKTYVFNNLDRQSLSRMAEDDNFVPLEIIQKSNMEETALLGIKEDVLSLAKQEQTITDKTHISVKTDAVPAVNADGEKIVNYNVEFTYEVEEEFSARDDFKPGRYHVEESKAATLMLDIMTKAFESDFKKYVVSGKGVIIKVKGTADASPINRTLPYDGKYGEYDSEPVYKNDELNNITLNKKGGIADNEQLAFARALGVKNYIENKIQGFAGMKTEFKNYIEVSKEEGSQFRRISVIYTFVDAF
jgi:hypothetical protein